jgi:thiosulfate/3-mercaptopyruvate sulfurtransferase
MAFTALIDVDSLRAAAPGTVILDCRFDLSDPAAGRRAYARAHIPGARYADLDRDLSSPVTPDSGRHPLPAPEALAGYLARAGIGKHTQVIVYDEANGAFAARAWWLLRWLGHESVAVLDGGFRAWTAAGAPTIGAPTTDAPTTGAPTTGAPPGNAPTAGSPTPGDPAGDALAGGMPLESGHPPAAISGTPPSFAVRLRPEAVLHAAQVSRALEDPRRRLVDARAPERFAGTVEPLDPVAGHVPGAVNHPFTGNLTEDGRFLPPVELRRRWLERLHGTQPSDAIMMCGSGVTACHNLLALEVAGLTGAKLYAGSWSEWIRDPQRPVARGPL